MPEARPGKTRGPPWAVRPGIPGSARHDMAKQHPIQARLLVSSVLSTSPACRTNGRTDDRPTDRTKAPCICRNRTIRVCAQLQPATRRGKGNRKKEGKKRGLQIDPRYLFPTYGYIRRVAHTILRRFVVTSPTWSTAQRVLTDQAMEGICTYAGPAPPSPPPPRRGPPAEDDASLFLPKASGQRVISSLFY